MYQIKFVEWTDENIVLEPPFDIRFMDEAEAQKWAEGWNTEGAWIDNIKAIVVKVG